MHDLRLQFLIGGVGVVQASLSLRLMALMRKASAQQVWHSAPSC